MTPVILLSILLCLFFLSLCNPAWGISGYFAVYALYNPDVWWGVVLFKYIPRPSYVAIIFIALGCVIHASKLNWKVERSEIFIYLFIALCWLISSLPGNDVDEISSQYLQKMLKIAVFLFLMIRSIRTLKEFKCVLITLVIAATFLSQQAHVIGRFTSNRLDNLGGIDFSEANAFAAFISIAAIVAGFYVITAPLWLKILLTIAIGLMMDSIIMSQSRGVFLGLIVASLYALAFMPKQRRKPILACIVLGVALTAILEGGGFLGRMTTIGESYHQGSGFVTASHDQLDRMDFWKASLKMLGQHPLGVGVKNYQKNITKYDYRNPGMDAHNTYVLCYSELGIPGLIIFLLIVFFSFGSLRRVQKLQMQTKDSLQLTHLALGCALTVYLTGYGMTHSCLYSEILWILLAFPVIYERAFLSDRSAGTQGSCLKLEGNSKIKVPPAPSS